MMNGGGSCLVERCGLFLVGLVLTYRNHLSLSLKFAAMVALCNVHTPVILMLLSFAKYLFPV